MDSLPAKDVMLTMEPEELAPHLLHFLASLPKERLNRHNIVSGQDRVAYETLGQQHAQYFRQVMEAWAWLEHEGFLAQSPDDNTGQFVFITRRGNDILSQENLAVYRRGLKLSPDLDQELMKYVKPLFVRGDFDTAVFRAYKAVEVRVRSLAKLPESDYGIDVANHAFGPGCPLTDESSPKAEQQRIRDLFVGALGTFKNPTSHRIVQFDDPNEVVDLIGTANQLLRMAERAASQAKHRAAVAQ